MKRLLTCLLLAMACVTAAAQSLPYGVSITGLAATRQPDGSSIITGTLANHGEQPVSGLSVTFVLYDAQGHEVGRTTGRRDTPLPPGQSWQVRATTPHAFSRFTAMDIKAAQ